MAAIVVALAVTVIWQRPGFFRLRAPTAREVDAIRDFCGRCHQYPEPEILPASVWELQVRKMYELAEASPSDTVQPPAVETTLSFYLSRAPAQLRAARAKTPTADSPVVFEPRPLAPAGAARFPAVSNLKLAAVIEASRLDVILCDMRHHAVLLVTPGRQRESVLMLATIPHPCHVEVTDLDRDGLQDLLVADLGVMHTSDELRGSIVWLRRRSGKEFEPIVVARGLGRVADVRAADFDDDGDLDLIAAVFGWRKVGHILLLLNESTPAEPMRFDPLVIDPRPGAIHVPVVDLDRDGRLDFVALISQESETVCAFLNAGSGRFTKYEISPPKHPAWGSSGIEVIDLDHDGDVDVLFANGDSFGEDFVRPYHGLTWLENRGAFPFVEHRLLDLAGAHIGKAADLDGDGDLDIAVCAFAPPDSRALGAAATDGVVWLEQTSPGQFQPHVLATGRPTHPTLDLGDIDADGDVDLVVGNLTTGTDPRDAHLPWAVLWENQSTRPTR
jgi:hypothetical protein